MGDDQKDQIESSDEYDPAQDIQLPGPPVPAAGDPHLASTSLVNPAAQAPNSATLTSPIEGEETASKSPQPQQTLDAAESPASIAHVQQSVSTQRRLPHDTMGILEDRIKEDEKGDLDAWLSLIDEYKKRGKSDEIRQVFDRFFTVFPQAVSLRTCLLWNGTDASVGRAMGRFRSYRERDG